MTKTGHKPVAYKKRGSHTSLFFVEDIGVGCPPLRLDASTQKTNQAHPPVRKKSAKNFQKTLDKPLAICYTNKGGKSHQKGKKKHMRICIFDTETVGIKTQTLFDIGYHIYDSDENVIIKSRRMVNGELFDNRFAMLNDAFMGEEKYDLYRGIVQTDPHCIVCNDVKMVERFEYDMVLYQVEVLCAYNCAFDDGILKKTAPHCNRLFDIPLVDLWGLACKHICPTADYRQFCQYNKYYSTSGMFLSTTAETVYRFIAHDTDFIETHTALEDARIEWLILMELLLNYTTELTYEKPKRIASHQIMTDNLLLPNGELLVIEYTKKYERNGVTKYKVEA
jgi:DNA polymerase III epsilon subunit-like protein